MYLGPNGELIVTLSEPEFDVIERLSSNTHDPDSAASLRDVLSEQRSAQASVVLELDLPATGITPEITRAAKLFAQLAETPGVYEDELLKDSNFPFVIPASFLRPLLDEALQEAAEAEELEAQLCLAREGKIEELRDRLFMQRAAIFRASGIFDQSEEVELASEVYSDEERLGPEDTALLIEAELAGALSAKGLVEFLQQHLNPPPSP